MGPSRRSILAAMMIVAGLGAGLQAHMKLEKSEPANGATLAAAPMAIELFFSEKIDVAVSKVVLKGASGDIALSAPHAMGDRQLMAPVKGSLPDGSYTVTWQSAGTDGHVVKGQLAFSVKRARTP